MLSPKDVEINMCTMRSVWMANQDKKQKMNKWIKSPCRIWIAIASDIQGMAIEKTKSILRGIGNGEALFLEMKKWHFRGTKPEVAHSSHSFVVCRMHNLDELGTFAKLTKLKVWSRVSRDYKKVSLTPARTALKGSEINSKVYQKKRTRFHKESRGIRDVQVDRRCATGRSFQYQWSHA